MIEFIGGKPRSGKTKLVATRFMEMLRFTTLPFVTNMAIKMDPWVDAGWVPRKGLLESCREKWGSDFDATRRIVFIEGEQVKRFYAVRVFVPKDDWEKRIITIVPPHEDFLFHFDGTKHGACCYFIDECHEFFPGAAVAQTTANHNREALSWGSQQARIGDRVWLISQVLMNVNKQLRGVSQKCTMVTNHRHISIGPFRQPDFITWSEYQTTPPPESEKTLNFGKLRYDKDLIHGLYDTASGVAVSGRTGADVHDRARGLHVAWFPVMAIILLACTLFFMEGCKRVAGKRLAKALTNEVPKGERKLIDWAGHLPTNTNAVITIAKPEGGHYTQELRSVTIEKTTRHENTNVVIGYVRGKAGCVVSFQSGSYLVGEDVRDFGFEIFVDGIYFPKGKGVGLDAKR